MALGPLTALATIVKNNPQVQAKIEKVYIVGGNLTSKDFSLSYWLMGFNLSLDKRLLIQLSIKVNLQFNLS